MPPITRLHSLDGLRGIAALFVAVYHFSANSWITTTGFVAHGWLSVDLFFVISGIVLDRRYFSRPNEHFKDFAVARMARMMPLYFIMLLVFLLMDGLAYVLQGISFLDLLWPLTVNIFALQSFGLLDRLWFYGPSWSISAEIWINMLLFPIALSIRSNKFLGAIVVVGTWLFTTTLDIQSSYDFGWLRCLVGISVGVTVSRVLVAQQRFSDDEIGTTAGIAISLAWVAAFFVAFNVEDLFSLSPLIFGLLCYLLIGGYAPQIRVFFSHHFLVYLGKISFAVYMTHFLIGGRIMRIAVPKFASVTGIDLVERTDQDKWGGLVLGATEVQGFTFVAVYLVAVVATAHFVMTFIELPLYRHFRRQFSPRPERA